MTKDEIRELAEADLEVFIKLVAPKQVVPSFHQELIQWMNSDTTGKHQLILIPRDHGKSRIAAFKVAWTIVRRPDVRVLYVSATADLAEKQLKFIKDILASDIVRRYWPELVHPDESQRERWTINEIAVDHPKRKEEMVRDPTVFARGITANITGLHCDITVLDDVVVSENAYNKEGRDKVGSLYSLLASIEGADAEEWVVGTRYHPNDLYGTLIAMEQEVFNETGEIVDTKKVYAVYERQVEDSGDGSGQFLWPRQQREDGAWFGFDAQILSQKKAKYIDRTQFYAQYYNKPFSPDALHIKRDTFQYYDPKKLVQKEGKWFLHGRPLNIYASMDMAYSMKKRADYSVIVVIGIDPDSNIYVLDVWRFKTDSISNMFTQVRAVHLKWDLRKLKAEVNSAQSTVVKELKDTYIRNAGLVLSIEEFRPQRHQGSKEERISAVLEPRYDNRKIWHYRGGNCSILEEELANPNPTHDDCKDALAAAIDGAIPPKHYQYSMMGQSTNVVTHSKFGGIC